MIDRPLTENDRKSANEIIRPTRGEARRNYYQRRQLMRVHGDRFRRHAAEYVSFHFDMDDKPLDERIKDSEQLKRLWDAAFEAYDTYQACIQHFHNAQADYRELGGRV